MRRWHGGFGYCICKCILIQLKLACREARKQVYFNKIRFLSLFPFLSGKALASRQLQGSRIT